MGTPGALEGVWGRTASAPPRAISRPENQLAAKTFHAGLHNGAKLSLSGSDLPPGRYRVFGLLNVTNSAACNGRAGHEISQFATLTVS